MIKDFLEPISQKHSIKEAVISLFLVNPIIKPERFQKLITDKLKDHFHLYENVNALQLQFQINPLNPVNPNTPPKGLLAGFKFIGFENGKIGRVLQGINDLNRTHISYHSFSYNRWDKFLEDYLKYIKILSEEYKDIFIKAVSIHYTDEFKWIENSDIDLNQVFNINAKYMSKAFFESCNSSNLLFNTEKNDNQCLYIDRLEIKVNNKLQKNILISHNITKQFDDYKNLDSLLTSDSKFNDSLTELHKYNKTILNDILNTDVKDLIGLKI